MARQDGVDDEVSSGAAQARGGGVRRLLRPRSDDAERDAAIAFHLAVPLQCWCEHDRADLLAAVRQELQLPLGALSVPRRAPHLEKATDELVVVAALDRRGRGVRAVLHAWDRTAGSAARYRVDAVGTDPTRLDLRLLRDLRRTVARAVLSTGPGARVDPLHDLDG